MGRFGHYPSVECPAGQDRIAFREEQDPKVPRLVFTKVRAGLFLFCAHFRSNRNFDMHEKILHPQLHYLRIYQIIGHKKRGIAPLLPVSASTWWAGVKSGKFPQPIKLGQRITVWRSDEIDALLRDLSEVRP